MFTDEEIRLISSVRRKGRLGIARGIRREAAISLHELAAMMGSTAASLSRYERGLVTPRAAVALRWARVLQIMDRAR